MYDVYSSPNSIQVINSRRVRWAWNVARMGENRGAYRALVGRPEGKGSSGRPMRRWNGNINPCPANVENMVSS
jgi:hypothetical protein